MKDRMFFKNYGFSPHYSCKLGICLLSGKRNIQGGLNNYQTNLQILFLKFLIAKRKRVFSYTLSMWRRY